MKAAETNLVKLLQGSKVFLVPTFQRAYSWRGEHWAQLWDDLIRECRKDHDEEPQTLDGHFLGSVVLHPAPGGASVLMRYIVVDGQQRLTTILALIAAIRDLGDELGVEGWNPKEYDDKYLVNHYDDDYPDRLRPTKLDRDAYVKTIRHKTPTEGIGQAYSFFAREIRKVVTSGDPEVRVDLATIAKTLLLHMVVVEINTTPGDSVNNIFNRLNSKGMQLSPADLVRNELLLLLEGHDELAEQTYDEFWLPMDRNLFTPRPKGERDDRKFVTFLWAREVARRPDTTRKNLFAAFEKGLRDAIKHLRPVDRPLKAVEIFKEMYSDHLLFLLMQDPLNSVHAQLGIGSEFREALEKLRRWNSDPTTPLALWLLKQVRDGQVEETEAVEVVRIVLGYLVRRALAGIPTNQLNRLITPIAFQLSSRGDKSLVVRLNEILNLPGYHWPGDAEVEGAVIRTPLYLSAKRQVPFILAELEAIHSPREQVVTSGLTIEHVMPQSMPKVWTDYIQDAGEGIDDALAVLHTLGNLTLTAYNSELGNLSLGEKKDVYAASKLSLNDEICAMSAFLPRDIEARSRRLARVLLATLPGPVEKSAPARRKDTELDDKFSLLENALQTLPEGGWTTAEDLVPFVGEDTETVHSLVERLGPEIARLVRNDDGSVPDWLGIELHAAVIAQPFEAVPHERRSATQLGELMTRIEHVLDGEAEEESGPDAVS